MTDIKIIPATPEMADALTNITIAAKRYWNYPEHWIQQWLPLLIVSAKYIQENETWVALADGDPAAYYSLKPEADTLWLDNLWVLPDQMGKGLGSSLFSHAVERSRQRGVSSLKIEADPNAKGFYVRMGAFRIAENYSTVAGQMRIIPVMEYKI